MQWLETRNAVFPCSVFMQKLYAWSCYVYFTKTITFFFFSLDSDWKYPMHACFFFFIWGVGGRKQTKR